MKKAEVLYAEALALAEPCLRKTIRNWLRCSMMQRFGVTDAGSEC
jgi:hypothetical protein